MTTLKTVQLTSCWVIIAFVSGSALAQPPSWQPGEAVPLSVDWDRSAPLGSTKSLRWGRPMFLEMGPMTCCFALNACCLFGVGQPRASPSTANRSPLPRPAGNWHCSTRRPGYRR